MIGSKAVITGLVTDKLWILVRTSETPSSVQWISDHMLLEFSKEWFETWYVYCRV